MESRPCCEAKLGQELAVIWLGIPMGSYNVMLGCILPRESNAYRVQTARAR